MIKHLSVDEKEVALERLFRSINGFRGEPKYTRFEVPTELADLNKKIYPMRKVAPIGYWELKRLELNWSISINASCKQKKCNVAPLYVEGWHPDAFINLPNFEYVLSSSKWSRNAMHMKSNTWCQGCSCKGRCATCSDHSGIFVSVESGSFVFPKKSRSCDYFWSFECNLKHSHSNKCEYKQLKIGRQVCLVVFYSLDKGWTLRTLEFIDKGKFITELTGEIITTEEADKRNVDDYQLELTKHFVLDARQTGNESRFLSHSCKPNCVLIRMYGAGPVFRVAVVAARNIFQGEELTIDYDPDCEPGGKMKCKCSALSCRGYV